MKMSEKISLNLTLNYRIIARTGEFINDSASTVVSDAWVSEQSVLMIEKQKKNSNQQLTRWCKPSIEGNFKVINVSGFS